MKYGIHLLVLILLASAPNSIYAQKFSMADSLVHVLDTCNSDSTKAEILNKLSGIYLTSDLEKCLEFGRDALVFAEKCGSKRAIVRSFHNIGNSNYLQGNYPESLESYLKALKINEEINDKQGIAFSLMGISNVYHIQNDYKLALEYQFKCLKMFEELGDTNSMAGMMNNIGIVYYTNLELEKALEYYQKSLDLKLKHGRISDLSSAYGNIGSTYCKMGRYSDALNYLTKAFEIRSKVENKKGMAISYIDIGTVHDSLKHYNAAMESYTKGLSLAEELNYGEGRLNACNSLTKLYAKMGNFQKSLEYCQMRSDIKDSIYNTQKSEQIAEMQTRYETDKKQKEIEILTLDKKVQDLQVEQQKSDILRQKIIIVAICFAMVIFIVIAIWLLKLYRFKRRANEALLDRNCEIMKQKEIIDQKNRDITDSIEYAKTIQESTFPTIEFIESIFPHAFVLFKPKDIISGDFYWAYKRNSGNIIWTAADCTGHGVPGALMSILGISLLNEIVDLKGIIEPHLILDELRLGVIKSLGHMSENVAQKDGIDLVLCVFDPTSKILSYASANNTLVHIRNNELSVHKGDKQPAGYYTGELRPFTKYEIQIEQNDTIYIFSDGYQDQFGGPNGEKFKFSRFKQLLLDLHTVPIGEQKHLLDIKHKEWLDFIDSESGTKHSQLDDIIIFGTKFDFDDF